MIQIAIPANGTVVPMLEWCQSQNLIYRRDWSWDRPNANQYVFQFAPQYEKLAVMFALKWS